MNILYCEIQDFDEVFVVQVIEVVDVGSWLVLVEKLFDEVLVCFICDDDLLDGLLFCIIVFLKFLVQVQGSEFYVGVGV